MAVQSWPPRWLHFPAGLGRELQCLCLKNRRNRFPWPVEASYLHVCRELGYNLDCTTTTLANYVAHCRTTQKVPKLKRPRDKLVVLSIHFWCSLMARPDPCFERLLTVASCGASAMQRAAVGSSSKHICGNTLSLARLTSDKGGNVN